MRAEQSTDKDDDGDSDGDGVTRCRDSSERVADQATNGRACVGDGRQVES